MKTNFSRRDDTAAAMFITALCIFAVSTMLVVGYLWLMMGQGRKVEESQTWNRAMAVTEAGVEEAMAQLNWGTSPGRSDLSTNGWGARSTSTPGVNAYGPPGQRILSGGSFYSSFTAPLSPITTNGASATIYSTGTVSAPISGRAISRRVEVTATMEPLFRDAIDVVSNFTDNGNSLTTDSWNSETNSLSTNGQYDSSKTSTNGAVGAEYGTVNLGNHTIYGNLYLGADATYTGSGTVDGAIYTNYNVQIADAQLPDGDWQDAVMVANAVTTNGTVVTTNHNVYNFTNSGSYRITAAGGAHPIQIAPGITVNLDIQLTSFDTTSSSAITILGGLNNAGTVNIYQESGPATLGLATGTYRPENFAYYGLPGVSGVTMSFSGSQSFVGVIYAPGAALKLNGGGSNPVNISGALVVQSITINGHYAIHYDQSLALYGPSKGFVATTWREF